MEEIENWGYNIVVDWTKHQEKGGARQYAEEDLKGLKECDCLVYSTALGKTIIPTMKVMMLCLAQMEV